MQKYNIKVSYQVPKFYLISTFCMFIIKQFEKSILYQPGHCGKRMKIYISSTHCITQTKMRTIRLVLSLISSATCLAALSHGLFSVDKSVVGVISNGVKSLVDKSKDTLKDFQDAVNFNKSAGAPKTGNITYRLWVATRNI